MASKSTHCCNSGIHKMTSSHSLQTKVATQVTHTYVRMYPSHKARSPL